MRSCTLPCCAKDPEQSFYAKQQLALTELQAASKTQEQAIDLVVDLNAKMEKAKQAATKAVNQLQAAEQAYNKTQVTQRAC